MNRFWILSAIVFIGCHDPTQDPIVEPDPLIAVKEKLEGIYQGTRIMERWYIDEPNDTFGIEFDTTEVTFIPQINYCLDSFLCPDSICYRIENIESIYRAYPLVCFSDTANYVFRNFHVSTRVYEFKWYINENRITTTEIEYVLVASPPDWTIRKVWRYDLRR